MKLLAHARWTAMALAMAFACTALTASPAPGREPPEVMVYAATSLRDALQDLAPRCEAALGVRLVFNFGGSNDLARQIEAGNKADIFFSADQGWMDHVARAGLVDAESRNSPLSNHLVVVVPKASLRVMHSADDLAAPDVRRLSLANPDAVPAGRYAKAWLQRAGAWDRLRDRVVPGVDVRAALAAVESGAVEAGIVYRTDAAISSRVRVIYEVPETGAPPISYALAALRDRPNLAQARRVVGWLLGPEAAAAFEHRGFTSLERPKKPVP